VIVTAGLVAIVLAVGAGALFVLVRFIRWAWTS
jgi:hypothetical protein